MNLKRSAPNHPIKIIQNGIIFWQEERGVSYEKGDGVINNFVGLSNHGCSLCSFDPVHRERFIALQALASSRSKTDTLGLFTPRFEKVAQT